MSNIPLARERIAQIANELRRAGQRDLAARLAGVTGLLNRRPAARRMRVRSRSITPTIREQILDLARTTDLHSSEIAARLGVNPGRVSEILQGDR